MWITGKFQGYVISPVLNLGAHVMSFGTSFPLICQLHPLQTVSSIFSRSMCTQASRWSRIKPSSNMSDWSLSVKVTDFHWLWFQYHSSPNQSPMQGECEPLIDRPSSVAYLDAGLELAPFMCMSWWCQNSFWKEFYNSFNWKKVIWLWKSMEQQMLAVAD